METVDPERASDEEEPDVLEVFEIREVGATLLAPADPPQTIDLSLSPEQELSRRNLLRHVKTLSEDIGPRHTQRPEALARAVDYVEAELEACGLPIRLQGYTTRDGCPAVNIEAIKPGIVDNSAQIVVGAHYDSIALGATPERDCPGANDNASGVAAFIEIARLMSELPSNLKRTVRFVAFANEEPPYFGSEDMGSSHYSRELKTDGVDLLLMICLETLGYYSDEPTSQMIPPPLSEYYDHDRGNFVAFISDRSSAQMTRYMAKKFAVGEFFPSIGLIADRGFICVSMSDQVAFWKRGYKALMVTDTVFLRTPKPTHNRVTYHTPEDTWEKINYPTFAKVTHGLAEVIGDLARV